MNLKFSREDKTNLLLGLFVGSLVLANLIGNKITFLWGLTFGVGLFTYPITFLITDIVEEVYGKSKTKIFIIAGFIALLFTLVSVYIAMALPPAAFWGNQEAFVAIFSQTPRLILASIVAFLLAQTHDIFAFEFWKKKTHGKFLWLRNNLSTIVSQGIDSTLFIFIGFYLVTPLYTVDKMIAMILPYYLLKILVAFADTPFVYLGVRWLRGESAEKKQ